MIALQRLSGCVMKQTHLILVRYIWRFGHNLKSLEMVQMNDHRTLTLGQTGGPKGSMVRKRTAFPVRQVKRLQDSRKKATCVNDEQAEDKWSIILPELVSTKLLDYFS
ncbi:hypothetical protein Tco_0560481 [Tanacetum coccineum]